MWKVKLSNLHKTGKYGKEIGEKLGNYQQNWEKSELSHRHYIRPCEVEMLNILKLWAAIIVFGLNEFNCYEQYLQSKITANLIRASTRKYYDRNITYYNIPKHGIYIYNYFVYYMDVTVTHCFAIFDTNIESFVHDASLFAFLDGFF